MIVGNSGAELAVRRQSPPGMLGAQRLSVVADSTGVHPVGLRGRADKLKASEHQKLINGGVGGIGTKAMDSCFYSKRSPEVWLTVGKRAWSQLPLSLKSRFLDGLERIAGLRDQIGAAAAVSSMPPVQVIPELWYDDDRCFDGCARPLIVNGSRVFGCTLPAQTATLQDEGLLRRVMVHEFCHCFWWLADEVNAMDSGGTTIDTSGLDQNSDSDDRCQMVDPKDWFGVDDASRMIYSGSPETQRIQDNLMGLIGSLPERHSPPKRFSLNHVKMPGDVTTHVRKLRISRLQNSRGSAGQYEPCELSRSRACC